MRFHQLTMLLGPVAIRDLIVGTSGITAGGIAFLFGCAYVSTLTLMWFAFWSVLGIVSLGMALPVLRLVRSMSAQWVVRDPNVSSFKVAA